MDDVRWQMMKGDGTEWNIEMQVGHELSGSTMTFVSCRASFLKTVLFLETSHTLQ